MIKRVSFFRNLSFLFLFAALPAFGTAITFTWTDGNGGWKIARNWDTSGYATNSSGMLKPGDSAGAINVTGNYTQTAGGARDLGLDATGSFDNIIITGAAARAENLSVLQSSKLTPAVSEVFQIMGSLVPDNFATPVSFIPDVTLAQAPVVNAIDLPAHLSIGPLPAPSTDARIATPDLWHITFRNALRILELFAATLLLVVTVGAQLFQSMLTSRDANIVRHK